MMLMTDPETKREKHRAACTRYRQRHKARVEKSNQRWLENNTEERRATCARYRKANKSKVAEADKHWRENNPDKARAKLRRCVDRFRREKPDRWEAIQARSRAKRANR
jgi:hypothetical protein